LNITELRYLVAIKKWGSVSAAAKQLYAAQPNVSKALKNLEEEYGLRIFERSSTGMIPTEQGRRFIEQAARVLEEVDRLTEDAHHARERCAELRVMIPHATYASYAAVDFLKEAAGADQLRIHIREGGSMEALDFVLRRGYHLALLRYAAEDDDHYIHYCARRGLKMEPVMEFEYRLLTNRDGPLAKHEVKDLAELNHYMEILHDDFQLPGEDGGDGVCFHVYCYNNQPGIKIDYATGDSHTTDGRTGTTGRSKSSAKSTKKHTTEPKATKSAAKSSGQSSRTVYTTPTGRCYHYLSGCGGKNSKKTTLKEAKSRGLRPCKKCAA